VPHDAAEPVGFRLEYAAASLGLLSDVGYITNLIREYLRGVDALFVEANYDQKLLEADTRRPWSTKQRISSRHGHLCNEQSAELVSELFAQSGHPDCAVVLGHLSSDCNTAELARGAVSQSCHQLVGMRLFVAEQKLATPLIPISAHSASAELNKDNEGSEDNESTEDAVGQLEEQSQLTF